jgi:long-chain acyl-CoA synthetase
MSFLPLSHALERTLCYYLIIFGGPKTAFVESVINTLMQDFVLARPTVIVSVPRIFEKVHATILARFANETFIKKAIFNWSMKIGAKNVKYNCQNIERKGLFKFQYNLANKLVFSKLLKAIGFDNLDFAISGGGPLSVSDAEFFLGMGVKLFEGYGLTEASPVVGANSPALNKAGSIGPPLVNTTVKISDEGEILIKGPQVMKGYYKQPAATKEMFDKKGFLKTGDLGHIDEDGYVWITGRIKDIIITAGGKNISPQNIESELLLSKWIEQCAVIGDKRKYLSLLIVPPFADLENWASKNGIVYKTREELVNSPGVLKLYKKEIDGLMLKFSQVEQIKKFKLMSKEWSQDAGELTPTLKVKRKVVIEKYHKEIEEMYDDDRGNDD